MHDIAVHLYFAIDVAFVGCAIGQDTEVVALKI